MTRPCSTPGCGNEAAVGRLKTVAILFARRDSIYRTIPGCDAWDMDRDARMFPGGMPVVAHPPCAQWGNFAMFARECPEEKALAPWAVEIVRREGGVLEHPAGSRLWNACELPEPGERDAFGGWTLIAPQFWWGHRAKKSTRFYICGCEPRETPQMPLVLGEAAFVIGDVGRAANGTSRPEISKADREKTPPAPAHWLVELARRCAVSTPATEAAR